MYKPRCVPAVIAAKTAEMIIIIDFKSYLRILMMQKNLFLNEVQLGIFFLHLALNLNHYRIIIDLALFPRSGRHKTGLLY